MFNNNYTIFLLSMQMN